MQVTYLHVHPFTDYSSKPCQYRHPSLCTGAVTVKELVKDSAKQILENQDKEQKWPVFQLDPYSNDTEGWPKMLLFLSMQYLKYN
jgi:hypothetical protein